MKGRSALPRTGYLYAGCAPSDSLLAVLAFPDELKDSDAEIALLLVYNVKQDSWLETLLDFEGRSLTWSGDPTDPIWWVLGKRGDVARVQGSSVILDRVPNAGTGPGRFGYLNAIRWLGQELFVCGYSRQFLQRLDHATWVRRDAGLLLRDLEGRSSLEEFDATVEGELYAVGWGGDVWRSSGTGWRQCDVPTNRDLHAVHCRAVEAEVIAVGAGATVLRGAADRWEVVGRDDLEEDFWGVSEFGGHVYVAGYDGIFRLADDSLEDVDLGLDRPVRGYRLVVSPSFMWSIGNRDLLRFDGHTWVETLVRGRLP